MELIILFLGLVAFLLITTLIDRRTFKNKIRKWIVQNYGKCLEKKDYNFDEINKYWNYLNTRIHENEKIDDITWNDLEMNNVFSRINGCVSFAGE